MKGKSFFLVFLLALLPTVCPAADEVPAELIKKVAVYYSSQWNNASVDDILPYYGLDDQVNSYAVMFKENEKVVGTVIVASRYDMYPFLASFPDSAPHLRSKGEAIIRTYYVPPFTFLHLLAQDRVWDPYLNRYYSRAEVAKRHKGTPLEPRGAFSPKEVWDSFEQYGYPPIANRSKPQSGYPKGVAHTIQAVPAYDQDIYGSGSCGPNASAQVLGYWDTQGYGNLLDNGSPSGSVPDKTGGNIAELQYDLMRAEKYNPNKGTMPSDITSGMEAVCNSEQYGNNLNFKVTMQGPGMVQWDDIVSEIDADRPIVFTNTDWYHHTTIRGYDQTSARILKLWWGHPPYAVDTNFDNIRPEAMYVNFVNPNSSPKLECVLSDGFEESTITWKISGSGWKKTSSRAHNSTPDPSPPGGNPAYSLHCDARSSSDVYLNDADSWATYGPFSTLGKVEGQMDVYVWMDMADANDFLGIYASVNNKDFYGMRLNGVNKQWKRYALNLKQVDGIGTVMDKPEVWVALHFHSDASGTAGGVAVDDVVIKVSGGSSSPSPQAPKNLVIHK